MPAGLSNVVAFSAGEYHVLALRSDGTVVGWGDNTYGQAAGAGPGITGISAGAYHSLALTTNGTVLAWGNNGYGQTTVPSGLSNVIAIAAGSMFCSSTAD